MGERCPSWVTTRILTDLQWSKYGLVANARLESRCPIPIESGVLL